MHCASRAVIGLWKLDPVITETFAIEAFVVCVGNAGFEAVAITFAHVGFELEEGF